MQKKQVCAGLTIISLALLLICSLVAPVCADLSWDVEIVDPNAAAVGNGYGAIILDSNGIPHIGYGGIYNPQIGCTGYAFLNGSDWRIRGGFNGGLTDLKLDVNNNPHVLTTQGVRGPLFYSRWTGTEWQTQTIPSTLGHNIVYAALALDTSGNPHITYTYGEGLKYASWTGSNWDIQTVDDSYSEVSFQFSLVLDKNDVPYIMYATPSSTYVNSSIGGARLTDVKLAVWKNSTWNIEPVLNALNLTDCWNMVLDSKGNLHFLALKSQYLGVAENTIYLLSTILYVKWDGAAWNTQTVVSDVDLSSRGFLALDAYDFPSIVYTVDNSSKGGTDLMYAAWTGIDWSIQAIAVDTPVVDWTGTEWVLQNGTSTPVRLIDGPCYLAVDSKGIPHISFRGVVPEQIHWHSASILYATATGTPPRIINVNSTSTVSAFDFDSQNSLLTFNIEGAADFVNVSIAKSYLSNTSHLRVYLDDAQVDYQVLSSDDFWILTFAAPENMHQVKIDFAASEEPFSPILIGGIVTAIILSILLVTTFVYRRKQKITLRSQDRC
ncbi:MAG: hypothetical protein NWF01_09315 [Candidatus Bathyarchaeota archaeon]|nr:hypothetical protein [Candidatus Bathyarchaeota archaeon]